MAATLNDPLLRKPNEEEAQKKAEDWKICNSKSDLSDFESQGKNEIAKGGTFWQTTANCVNLLFGVGMLATPFAVQQAGWLSLFVLLGLAFLSCYTGYVLGSCLKTRSGLRNYQDIGTAAFGSTGRLVISTLVYLEIAAYTVTFTISLGDNLAQIFPNAALNLPWLNLQPRQFLVTVAMLIALPTVWVRDVSSLSFLSSGGILSSLVVVVCVAWTGLFGGVGFSHSPPIINLTSLPIASGIYACCFAGHVILPNIASSMKNPSEFPRVLMWSFTISTTVYGGLALLGAIMFGQETQTQITLNIPAHLAVGTIALWTAVLTPLTKFSLGLAPIGQQLESFLPFPSYSKIHLALGTCIRTTLVLSNLAVALLLPYFGNVLSLIGSALSVSMSVTLPCIFYLKLFGRSLSKVEIGFNVLCIMVGLLVAIAGSKSSLFDLIEDLRH